MPDNDGVTRRERYAAFDPPQDAPEFELPPAGVYLWNWFFSLSDSVSRVTDGHCRRIPPSEFLAWREAADVIVYPREYGILQAMDAAYCEEVNKELASARERAQEARQRELDALKAKAKRGGRR